MPTDCISPGIDGYALCRRLKGDWETEGIPLVFMSASDDIETRLQCYEAGGDDFIVKPFMPAEMRLKIGVAQRPYAAKLALYEQAGYAQRTAMSAMASVGELAEALLAAMRQYDLHAAVQLRSDGPVRSLSDNAALLAEGADARLQALEAVQESYRRNCFKLSQVMVEFEEGLMKSFVNLGLTESQEESLTAMASGFMQRMVGTQDKSLEIVGSLQELAKCLERLLRR